ncbi:MAG: hypothetical protein AAFS07_19340, partial [Pseudomonadota bacterium]
QQREALAATAIQAVVRGGRGRVRAAQRRAAVEEEHRQAGLLLDQAAGSIQSAWRQRMARERVRVVREAKQDKEKMRELKRREAAALKAKREAADKAEREQREAEARAKARAEEERRAAAEHRGAVAVQRLVRGLLGRRRAAAAAARREAWLAEKERRRRERQAAAAATAIQRMVLGFLAARRVARRREAHARELAALQSQ